VTVRQPRGHEPASGGRTIGVGAPRQSPVGRPVDHVVGHDPAAGVGRQRPRQQDLTAADPRRGRHRPRKVPRRRRFGDPGRREVDDAAGGGKAVHVVHCGSGVPATGKPHAHAAEPIPGRVLPTPLDVVEPGQFALEAPAPDREGVVDVVRRRQERVVVLECRRVVRVTNLEEPDALGTLTGHAVGTDRVAG
jgi:hypothetical protein